MLMATVIDIHSSCNIVGCIRRDQTRSSTVDKCKARIFLCRRRAGLRAAGLRRADMGSGCRKRGKQRPRDMPTCGFSSVRYKCVARVRRRPDACFRRFPAVRFPVGIIPFVLRSRRRRIPVYLLGPSRYAHLAVCVPPYPFPRHAAASVVPHCSRDPCSTPSWSTCPSAS